MWFNNSHCFNRLLTTCIVHIYQGYDTSIPNTGALSSQS